MKKKLQAATGTDGITFDTDRQGTELPPLVVCARRRRKEGARAMTMKERLAVHRQIEQDNARKLREWKERGRAA